MSYFLWEDECPDPPALFSGTLQPGPIYLPNSTVPSLSLSDPPSFLGDALSVAGCGWHLEDTPQQMYQSLTKILGTLPPQTVREPWQKCGVRILGTVLPPGITYAFVPGPGWAGARLR